jgi:hypothetical protein
MREQILEEGINDALAVSFSSFCEMRSSNKERTIEEEECKVVRVLHRATVV